MKKILFVAIISTFMLGFASCKKNNPSSKGSNPFVTAPIVNAPPVTTLPVGSVPKSFTQKALIEEFTGEWCGACPGGASLMESIMTANPDKVYGAAIHYAQGGTDPYGLPFFSTIQNYFIAGSGITSVGFPNGIISRNLSISAGYENSVLNGAGDWQTLTNTVLAKTAKCGLGLVTKEAGDKLSVDVYVGYNAPVVATKGSLKITVYLIENDLPSINQAGGGAGYLHQHVLRHVISGNLGDDIDLSSGEKYTKVSFKNVDIAGKYKNKNNLHVIAFVNQDATAAKDLDILNVQEAGINETKKWD